MIKLVKVLQQINAEHEKKIKEIKNFLKNAPEGYVKINTRKNNRYVYYHMSKGIEKEKGRYLSNTSEKETELIKLLIKKSYYTTLLKALEKEQGIIKRMLKNYHPIDKYKIYEKLPESRKKYVEPLFVDTKELVHQWELEPWEPYYRHSENLIYETNGGIVVRSKSEMIIADILEKNKEYCAYRYEAELVFGNNRMSFHPDFTIRKRSTGKTFYWEHFGMMSDPKYAADCLAKINTYILEGIFPGDQLIMTFESIDQPLDPKVVRALVKHYFIDE